MKTIYLIVISLIITTGIHAGSIKGKILNPKGEPLEGASIQVLNFNYQTISNLNGEFEINNIPAGNYTLVIKYLGYETLYRQVGIDKNNEKSFDLVLKPGEVNMNIAVTVTGSRIQDNQFNAPASISSLNANNIENEGTRTSAEALLKYGAWPQKTNHGGGSPFVRGLTGYHTLIMIDGVRLNNSIFRSGPNQYVNTIDPLSISNIEIVRGTGSTQYGSDALGGTIQYFSKSPKFSKGNKLAVHPGFYYKYASQSLNSINNGVSEYFSPGMENIMRGEIELSNNKVAFVGGFSYKTFKDIDAAESIGRLAPNAYDEYDFDAKLVSRLSNNQFLTLALQKVNQQNVPLYHKVAPGSYSTYDFDPQDRLLAYAKHELHNQNRWFRKLSTTFSYQNSLEVRKKQKTGESNWTEEKDIADVYGVCFETYSIPTKFWKINSGVEYYHDIIKSETKSISSNEEIISRGLYPDNSTFDNFGIYSLHSFDFEKWNIQAGARFNSYKLSVKDTTFGNVDLKPFAVAGNLAITYKLNNSLRLIGAVNNGFRTPNINDVSSFGIADFRYEVPSTELKPEKSLTYEIGLKQKSDFISSSIFLFRTDLFDLITNTKTSFKGQDSVLINQETGEYVQYYHKENSNKARILGFEAQTEVRFNQSLSFLGRLFYTFGKDISKDEPMRRIPPLNGVMAFKWQKMQKLSATLEYIFAAKQDRLSGGDIDDSRIADGGTPAWNLINLNCGFQLKKWARINLGLNNIFDEAYRIHGSGVDGYGRHLWLGIRLQL